MRASKQARVPETDLTSEETGAKRAKIEIPSLVAQPSEGKPAAGRYQSGRDIVNAHLLGMSLAGVRLEPPPGSIPSVPARFTSLAHYYSTFQVLVLEEARATVADALERRPRMDAVDMCYVRVTRT